MARMLFITGSWRKNSNSSWLAAKAAEAARKNGHAVTITDIARLNIGPCRACMSCRKTQDGRCILKDDMGQIYPMLEEADVLVLAHEGDDPYDSGGINAIRSIQDICSYRGAVFAGALYGCANDAGEAARNPALLKKAQEYGAAL